MELIYTVILLIEIIMCFLVCDGKFIKALLYNDYKCVTSQCDLLVHFRSYLISFKSFIILCGPRDFFHCLFKVFYNYNLAQPS